MALSLPDKWISDFWLTEHGGTFHLFYLQAPKSIGDPQLRHWNVSIGHAAWAREHSGPPAGALEHARARIDSCK